MSMNGLQQATRGHSGYIPLRGSSVTTQGPIPKNYFSIVPAEAHALPKDDVQAVETLATNSDVILSVENSATNTATNTVNEKKDSFSHECCKRLIWCCTPPVKCCTWCFIQLMNYHREITSIDTLAGLAYIGLYMHSNQH